MAITPTAVKAADSPAVAPPLLVLVLWKLEIFIAPVSRKSYD
jgi:hypothetical protein